MMTLYVKTMTKNILKSIGAVLAGLVFIVVTHTGTDAILESVGVLPKDNLFVGIGLILVVIGYRAVWSVAGCYITARLAPSSPMKHSLILGGIGALASAAGAKVTVNMNLGPAWYPWVLVSMALPLAWLGGKLYKFQSRPLTI